MVNKVILIGNVGADPEIKSFEGDVKMARIRLATTERIYNKDTKTYKEATEWHTITMWRGLADVVDKYVSRGTRLYIEGKIRTREYEKNGIKCFTTEIACEDMKLLSSKRESEDAPQPQRQQATSVSDYPIPPLPEGIDEIPF